MAGTLVDQASPGWSVGCGVFPGGDVDVEVFQVGLQGVFVAPALTSNFSLAMSEFTVEQLFGDSRVRHSRGLAHGGDNARELCPLQHLGVGDLILPADVEDAAKTLEMELMELFFVSPVDGPGFAAVQKCGQDDCHVDFDFGAL